ncbi:MAG: putative selenium-dependent hydroxylase accessory protein YqeC [Ardenticatenia bacterium]|nr:MAG: putative selenium-dependent hydroxylase accessory protein YqeC [Ardenticatenia bacterium]
MNLSTALRIKHKSVVSIVGGGGKTSTMYRLANELAARGWRVVSTTTTRLFEAQAQEAPAIVPLPELETLSAALDRYGHVLVAAPREGDTKRPGIPPEAVDTLIARPDVDAVIVEADGSRRHPLKAPAEHEPVVPASTTHLVAIAGIECVGAPLTPDIVHRPERVAALTGRAFGEVLTPSDVAHVLTHPQGGAKALPAGAAFYVLLNKVEDEQTLHTAREVAAHALHAEHLHGVLLAAVRRTPPVRERHTRVAGVVLAAGQASRFGRTKQLLDWRGTPMVAHVVRVAQQARLAPIIVVVGHEAERVAAAVEPLGVQVVFNAAYAEGQATSVAAGVRALPPTVGAACFLLADQPLITPATIRALVEAHRQHDAALIAPEYAGQRGNPVLFDKEHFADLARLQGDTGGRALFKRLAGQTHLVPVDDPGVLIDLDTPDAYAEYCGESD